jgi:HEAT repeat protein
MQNLGAKTAPILEQGLKSAKEPQLRIAILHGLIVFNHRAKAMVGPLTDCLMDKNPQVRGHAAQVLGNIGTDAKDALPMLRALLDDSNPTVRQQVQAAIDRIDPPKQ